MKYIYSDNEGEDRLEIETDGERVIDVVTILPSVDGASPYPTADELQSDLEPYLESPEATIETALANWVGGYSTIRRA